MPADRQDSIWSAQKTVAEEFVELTPGETCAHAEFEALAFGMLEEMRRQGAIVMISLPHPENASFGLHQIRRAKASISAEPGAIDAFCPGLPGPVSSKSSLGLT